MAKKILKLIISCSLILAILFVSGCRRKPAAPPRAQITLNYYKLFDDTAAIQPIIKAFEDQYPHININYKKFTDLEEFTDLIVNEIAEDSGPDIFSLPNTWIKANYRKITPAPTDIIPPNAFAETFLDVATEDLVYGTGTEGTPEVHGIPLTIDTLALYYNQDQFEKNLPERGKPGTTWSQFEQDVIKLRRLVDDRIIQAGAAIGRSDNVNNAVDILYTLFLQNGIDFYSRNNQQATFASGNDAAQAIQYYTGFATPGTAAYTWNREFLTPNSESEITKFINGEISMIFGYSHLYQDLINQIRIAERSNQKTIDPTDIRIAPIPQVSSDPNDHVAYANYFVETVSRTSQHPREAWTFLRFLVNQQNLQTFYREGGFKPTSRRDLIESQRQNAIYRPFVEQLGLAQSIPQADPFRYEEILSAVITEINNGENARDILEQAQTQINSLIPSDGVQPPPAQL